MESIGDLKGKKQTQGGDDSDDEEKPKPKK